MMKKEELKGLIERVIQEDQEAFQLLYEVSNAYVYKSVRGFGIRCCDCDDIIQNVFIDVYRKLYQLEDYRCYFKWLYMVTRSATYRFVRSFYRIKTEDYFVYGESYELQEDHTPIQNLNEVIRREAVIDLLNEISVNHAMVLSLRYLQELSMDEIAQQCAIPLGTAKSRLHQARQCIQSLPDAQRYLQCL